MQCWNYVYKRVYKYSKNFLIKTIISQLKSKRKFVKLNNPNAKIDIISTKDAVKAMYKIMQLEKPNTFIISRNKFISIKQIYNQISKKMGINKKILINSKKNMIREIIC